VNLRALIAAGLVALSLGLLLGLVPSSVTTASGDTTCGSPWVRDNRMVDAATEGSRLGADLVGAQVGRRFESTDYRALCTDALGSRGTFGGVLAAFGLLTLLGVALVNARSGQPRSESV
jgi:hypothetical protein